MKTSIDLTNTAATLSTQITTDEIKSGISTRRPTALNLPKLKTKPPATATETQFGPSTSTITEQNYVVKRHDLGFKNLSYTVKSGLIKRELKTIINGIHGNFKAGELTAIMGPSGAGKSTLLNILSSYTTHNLTGEILGNGQKRDEKRFIKQSAYIMQDIFLQPHLTVIEAMYFSSNLKLGSDITKAAKRDRVKNILEAMGMYETRHTKTCNLSGGQKKRLSIALELVNNPPVILLDEPTSGLDSSTSTQCITLLKKLAQEGRTIICTIHQPSALVFGMFDHLFAIAEGRCIYSGSTQNVVRFLAELNLKCPESYNPSDYLLEISTNDYGYENDRLVEKISNGRCELYRQIKQSTAQIEAMDKVERMMEAGLMTPVKAPIMKTSSMSSQLTPIKEFSSSLFGSSGIIEPTTTNNKDKSSISKTAQTVKCCLIKNQKKPNLQIDPSKLCQVDGRYESTFCKQLTILLMRGFLILWRDKTLTLTRLIMHGIMGLFIGSLYYNIGNDASNILNIFRYIFFSIMFLMYTAFSSTSLNFPLEFPIVQREHFNRWYSLRAYYIALTLIDIPIQFLCSLIFIGLTYFLTNQPFELYRLAMFFNMCLLSALVAQSIGLIIGSAFSVKNGAIFGPFFICPFLIFSGFFIQITDVHQIMHWLFHISFLKYALEGSALAIFGYNRGTMTCDAIYCHYRMPKYFLKSVGMHDGSYEFAVIALIFIFFMLRFISFYIMSYRLRLNR